LSHKHSTKTTKNRQTPTPPITGPVYSTATPWTHRATAARAGVQKHRNNVHPNPHPSRARLRMPTCCREDARVHYPVHKKHTHPSQPATQRRTGPERPHQTPPMKSEAQRDTRLTADASGLNSVSTPTPTTTPPGSTPTPPTPKSEPPTPKSELVRAVLRRDSHTGQEHHRRFH
jgi:hypothetical protein